MSETFDRIILTLREELEKLSAVEVAELFLSPHISPKVFVEATYEPGPTMWIVNRSDISSAVLEMLLKHPITAMAERAAEKLKMRKATITHLSPPEVPEDLSKVEDYGIEDILGHPLCPWEAILYYAIHVDDDVRASACLSLARRLWEHPAQSMDFPAIQSQFKDVFTIIAAEDLSPMVRAYAARIPIWSQAEVANFVLFEPHPHVQAKWVQHDNFPENIFEELFDKIATDSDDIFLRRVLALDARIPKALRQKMLLTAKTDVERLIHEAYLS